MNRHQYSGGGGVGGGGGGSSGGGGDEYDESDEVQQTSQARQVDMRQGARGGSPGCFKRLSKFLFSHIGLVLMVVLYSVAGSFLFALLEQHEEAKSCEEGKGQESTNIVALKSQLLSYIQFNISSNPSDMNKDNETVANAKIEEWLTEFRNKVLNVKSTFKFIGQDCATTHWDFAGALLFAITVITTIGYGNITPVTWEGQIVCICYATIGIPLFLMCIANISGVLGDMFRFVYSRICCRLCSKKKAHRDRPAAGAHEDPTTAAANIDEPGMTSGAGGAKVVDDSEDLGNDLQPDENEEKVTVPLTITMIIITLYILIGAVIFNEFENWTLIQSGYFCYITLSTIGFGDFVPGQNADDAYKTPKLILGAIYVLFGMAILAMCFDLMQEEIIAKFTWLGKKLGIIDKEEDDQDEQDADLDAAAQTAAPSEKETAFEATMHEAATRKRHASLTAAADRSEALTNKKSKPVYVGERTSMSPIGAGNFGANSPVPSYHQSSAGAAAVSTNSYLSNVVQRQYKS